MNFFQFLEAKYTENTFSIEKDFSLKVQAQAQSAQNIITATRAVYRWFGYASLLFDYLMVKMGLRPAPIDAYTQISKKAEIDKQKRDALKAAKAAQEPKVEQIAHKPIIY